MVAMQRACVRRQGPLPTTKQFVERGTIGLAGNVPECNVDSTQPELVHFPQSPLHVVVQALTLERVLSDQVRRHLANLRVGVAVPTGMLTRDALAGLDGENMSASLTLRTGQIDRVETVVVASQIRQRVAIFDNRDPGDCQSTSHKHSHFHDREHGDAASSVTIARPVKVRRR